MSLSILFLVMFLRDTSEHVIGSGAVNQPDAELGSLRFKQSMVASIIAVES